MSSSFQDILNRNAERAQEAATGRPSTGISGFVESAVSSMTRELIGLDPSPGVEGFRARNPELGLVSQVAGFAVPYAGWANLAKLPVIGKLGVVTRFEDFIQGIGASSGAITRGALRSTTRFAPFEAGRIGGAVLAGGDVGGTTLEAGINLGIEGVLGAAGGALRAFGRATPARVFEAAGVSPDDPMQVVVRKLEERAATLTASRAPSEEIGKVTEALNNIRAGIRMQIPTRGKPSRPEYTSGRFEIGGILDPKGAEGFAESVNRWFSMPRGGGMVRGENQIKGPITENTLEGLGGPRVLGHMQFPRELIVRGARKRTFERTILNRLQQVDDLGWIGKEADDGLWLVVKKVKPSAQLNLPLREGLVAAPENFVMFKTDNPGLFFPKKALWEKNVADKAFHVDTISQLQDMGSPLIKDMNDFFTLAQFEIIGGAPKGLMGRAMNRLGLSRVKNHELFNRVGGILERSVVPAAFESRGLRHRRLNAAAREVFHTAQNLSNKMLYGVEQLPKGAGAWAIIRGKTLQEAGIIQKLEQAPAEFGDDLLKVTNRMSGMLSKYSNQIKPKDLNEAQVIDRMFASGEISGASHALLKEMLAVDKQLNELTGSTLRALGADGDFQPLFGHMLVSRTWEGDWRATVMDRNGNRVWISGGKDRASAQRAAQKMIDESGDSSLHVGHVWGGDRTSDIKASFGLRTDMPEYRVLAETARKLNRTPSLGNLKARKGELEIQPGGAMTDRALKNKELAAIITEHIERRTSYLAEMTVRKGMYGELDRLRLEDPTAFDMLMKRVDDLAGKQGPFSRMVNNAVDAVLSPVLGPNSASKIVHTVNEAIFHLELGMGNIMFPVVNALTFMQTTLPHLAYTMTAHRDMLQNFYTMLPAAGADGLVKGSIGVLQPLQVAWAGMKLMRSFESDAGMRDLFERAVSNGIITPKVIEQYAGQNASKLTHIRGALSSGDYAGVIRAISSFLPAMSENFSRLHSFSTGVVLAKDIMKQTDPDVLYRFGKEFTENTMFMYSAADRARVITGPLGSLFGLFKNWQMHYMGWMLTYASEGALRGNWAPMLWQVAGTWSVAGAKGLPFYGVAEAFSEWASDKSMMENIYSWFGPADRDSARAGGDSIIPDAIYMGLPSLLGASLTGSTAAPFSDPVRDASMLMSFVQWDRAKALGQAIGGAVDYWSETGTHPIQNDETRRLVMRAVGPRALYRAMSVFEGDMLASTQTGYPSVQGLSLGERFMYGMGFNPRWLALQFDVQKELWENQDSLRAGITFYGEQIANAKAARDWQEVTRLTRLAMIRGVPMDSVWRSVNARESKMEEDTIQRQFSAAEVGSFRQQGLVR